MAKGKLDRIVVWVQHRKDRDSLYLQWHEPGTLRRKSQSAETNDPDIAANKARDLEYELNHGIRREPTKMTWEQFTDLYEEEYLGSVRPRTKAKALQVLASFDEHCKPKSLGDVSAPMLSRYAVKLRMGKRAAFTIHGHLSYLRTAFNWAVDQGYLTAAPKIKFPDTPKKSFVRTVTKEEFERLLAKAPNDNWTAFLLTAWHTGMRRNELFDLRWHEGEGPYFDFGQQRVMIPAAYNKANEDQWIPLHPDLAKALGPLRRPRGRAFDLGSDPSNVSSKFAKLAKAAGVRVTLHDLRRSFGSRYAAVVTAPILQRLMRHADIDTTMKFYTNIDSMLDDAIRRV